MFTRKRRASFGLNTTSTADISFVLLIFFLVTTSMDQDKGLTRQLPPADRQEQPVAEVDKRNVLTLALSATDHLSADGQPIATSQVAERVERLVHSRGQQHVVKLEIDPSANYEAYFALQNQLAMAYARLRDGVAHRLYHKAYADCTAAERDEVRQACPQRIVENYRGQEDPRP